MDKLRAKHPSASRPALPWSLWVLQNSRQSPTSWLRTSWPLCALFAGAVLLGRPASVGTTCKALATPHGDEVAAKLAQVVELLVTGQAPLELAPHMARATLYAQPKGDNDVRPIAVGETLRRLASKCLCKAVREAAQEWLSPSAAGCDRPSCEAAVHTSRQWFRRNTGAPNKAFLSLDFTNAWPHTQSGAMGTTVGCFLKEFLLHPRQECSRGTPRTPSVRSGAAAVTTRC